MIYQDGSKKDIILAVTYLKLAAAYEEKAPSAFMNIYFLAAQEDSHVNLMDAGAMSQIQPLMLDFYPLKLMHHQVEIHPGRVETCFLLSGNDSKIHVFRQATEMQEFYEDQAIVENYFPELLDVNGCVTQMELKTLDATHRLTALGLQSGLVTLFLVNTVTQQIDKRWETDMDSPITSIQLFSHHVTAHRPDFLQATGAEPATPVQPEDEAINLLITSAIDPAVVFCDVLESDLNKRHVLPRSNNQDVVLCSCIMDIDFDGENEILIGTYGQVLLAYKLMQERTPGMLMTSTPFQSPKPVPVGPSMLDPPMAPPSTNFSEEKAPHPPLDQVQEKSDRRRHKSLAGTVDSSGSPSKHEKHDRHRSDDSSLLEGCLREGQVARLVRSQENLAAASPRSVYFQTPETSDSYEFLPHGSLPDLTEYPSYRLKWMKRFCDPVMGLTCDDMMGDGMLDLVVLTLKGLHILQPNLNEVAELLLERLRPLCNSKDHPKNDSAESTEEESGMGKE